VALIALQQLAQRLITSNQIQQGAGEYIRGGGSWVSVSNQTAERPRLRRRIPRFA
jgi:hypothetical protein